MRAGNRTCLGYVAHVHCQAIWLNLLGSPGSAWQHALHLLPVKRKKNTAGMEVASGGYCLTARARAGGVVRGNPVNTGCASSTDLCAKRRGFSMQTVVGIFTSREAAERGAERLRALGIAPEHINLLVPGASEEQLARVPTTETEQPGVGPAIGGVVGGAVGASSGLVAPTIISTLIPGIGAITAIGLAALGIIGAIGGALAGVAAGAALEYALSHGIPKDELFVYKDALKHGRTVLIAFTDDVKQEDAARQALALAGAESIDAARDRWWLGLRDTEAEAYTAQGGDFTRDEAMYRRGFEAALHDAADGKPYKDVEGYLRARYPDVCDTNAFRYGYERGRAYSEGLQEKSRG